MRGSGFQHRATILFAKAICGQLLQLSIHCDNADTVVLGHTFMHTESGNLWDER
jgi:hypothetical protein